MEGPIDPEHLIDKVLTEAGAQINLLKVKIIDQEAITEAEFLPFALDLQIEQVGKIDLECQSGQQVVQTVQIIVQGFLLE